MENKHNYLMRFFTYFLKCILNTFSALGEIFEKIRQGIQPWSLAGGIAVLLGAEETARKPDLELGWRHSSTVWRRRETNEN